MIRDFVLSEQRIENKGNARKMFVCVKVSGNKMQTQEMWDILGFGNSEANALQLGIVMKYCATIPSHRPWHLPTLANILLGFLNGRYYLDN